MSCFMLFQRWLAYTVLFHAGTKEPNVRTELQLQLHKAYFHFVEWQVAVQLTVSVTVRTSNEGQQQFIL